MSEAIVVRDFRGDGIFRVLGHDIHIQWLQEYVEHTLEGHLERLENVWCIPDIGCETTQNG